MRKPEIRAILLSSALTIFAFPLAAQAQVAEEPATVPQTATAEEPQMDSQEILVTGSRVARTGMDAPTPRTVVGSDLLESLGQSNIAEAIRFVPQNIASQSDANVGYGASANVGSSFVNLRGLNPTSGTRTLTLVNTRRFIPSSDGGSVDLNVIPSALIERVETVTGGASAAYGSDAVAGVVNVILNRKFTGFKAEIDYGQTTYGDGKNYHGSVAWGTRFAGDRGHIAAAFEYQKQEGIGACSDVRPWCAEGWDFYTNAQTILPNGTLSGYNIPGSPGYGLPNFIVGPNSRQAFNDPRGVVRNRAPAALAARNKRFNDAGTGVLDFDPGLYVSNAGLGARQGGDGASTYADSLLRTPVTRKVAYAFGHYELTPSWELSGEFTYATRDASSVGSTAGPRSTYFVKPTNPFVPADLRALLNGTEFSLGKDLDGQIKSLNTVDAKVFRGMAGLKGEIGSSWVVEAYYQYGENRRHQTASRSRVNTPFVFALDAVVGPGGKIVCAETLKANPDPRSKGCEPMNMFGLNNLSQAAIDYVYRPVMEDFFFKQHAASANIRGELFSGRSAGGIGVAAGIDWRSEGGNVVHGNITDYADYNSNFGLDYAGSIQVLEGFGEANVPVFKDWVLGKGLELNGAVRWTRNRSTNDVTKETKVTTALSWKAGAIYEPFDMLRFRATRSRDIRIAGFRELFLEMVPSETGSAAGTVDNPNIPGSPQLGDDPTPILSGGSFALGAEKADTTTLGAVFSPSFIPGLRIGVDWYQIQIRDAVTNLNGQRIVDFCFKNNTFCDRITSNSPTDITFIDARRVNLGRFVSRGFDIEVSYDMSLSSIVADWAGKLNVRLLGTNQYDFLIQAAPDVPAINYAGQAAQLRDTGDFSSSPKWLWNGFVTYSTEPFTAALRMTYVGGGKLDVGKIGPEDPGYSTSLVNSISTNRVKSAAYFSLGLTYRLPAFDRKDGIELFGVFDNIFAKDPAIAPGGGGFNLGSFYPTNPTYHDTFGPRYKAGVRIKF
ncbi:TonB-dependent receptor plug domain-containing protein [Sphingomonas soli]|uniref:TonB-dependent receptor plug domain-containing protein n=1 Tax=Sphingomonas soli TaxID=266127 RepID=UPI00082F985E|nr:TonB-dependent receptor plug domain-containing protein [Sphingomonas soli]